MVQTAMAVPVEGTEGAFWLYVPAEVLGNLTLQLYHPAHSYIFFPESGSPLTGLTDAGLIMDSPGFPRCPFTPGFGICRTGERKRRHYFCSRFRKTSQQSKNSAIFSEVRWLSFS